MKEAGKGESRFIGVRCIGKEIKPSLGMRKGKLIRKEWKAQIRIGGKISYLGYYYSDIGAARAYNKEAKKLGRKLNIIS